MSGWQLVVLAAYGVARDSLLLHIPLFRFVTSKCLGVTFFVDLCVYIDNRLLNTSTNCHFLTELIYMDTDFSDSVSNSSNLQTMLYADVAEITAAMALPAVVVSVSADAGPNLPSKTMNTEPQNSAFCKPTEYASVHRSVSATYSVPVTYSANVNQHSALARTNSDDSSSSNTYEEAVPVIPPRKSRPLSVRESLSAEGLVSGRPLPPLAKFKPVVPERLASMAGLMQTFEPQLDTTSLQLKPVVGGERRMLTAASEPKSETSSQFSGLLLDQCKHQHPEVSRSSAVDAPSHYATPVTGSKCFDSDDDDGVSVSFVYCLV